MPAFTGWVEESDCHLCDATVSFAVYETERDWQTELGVAVHVGDGVVTGTEKYVYNEGA